jgi:hydrogenase/urease accessory protein HupE
MKHYAPLALGLLAFPAAAHPGHTDGATEGMLHAVLGHGPALGAGLLASVVAVGLLVRFVRARRRQLERRGQLRM